MNASGDQPKLPVPAPWEPHVLKAMDDLAARTGFARTDIAPTRVAQASWQTASAGHSLQHGLTVWLMAKGRTHRYRANLATGEVTPEGALGT